MRVAQKKQASRALHLLQSILVMQPKHLLLSCFILIGFCAKAQFSKGTKMIGASILTGSLNTGTAVYTFPNNVSGYDMNQNRFNLAITPSAGIFLTSKTVLGGSLLLDIASQKQWYESPSNGNTYKQDKSRTISYGAGVFLRQYFGTAGNLLPFGQAFINGGSSSVRTSGYFLPSVNSSQTYEGESSGSFFYNTGINLGLTKLLTPAVGIDAFVGYGYSYNKMTMQTIAFNTNPPQGTTESRYEPTQKFTGHGLSLGLGIQVFLPRK